MSIMTYVLGVFNRENYHVTHIRAILFMNFPLNPNVYVLFCDQESGDSAIC